MKENIEEIKKDTLDIMRNIMISKIENEFKNRKNLNYVSNVFSEALVYEKKWLDDKERTEKKNRTLSYLSSDVTIARLFYNDFLDKKIFVKEIFGKLNQRQTEVAIELIFERKNITEKFWASKILDNKNSHVIEVFWNNKALLKKLIGNTNIAVSLDKIDTLLEKTNTKNLMNAFNLIYNLSKKDLTESVLCKLNSLEDKYLTSIQKIMLEKSNCKQNMKVVKKNQDKFVNFYNKEIKKFIDFQINLTNIDIENMGYISLYKYFKDNKNTQSKILCKTSFANINVHVDSSQIISEISIDIKDINNNEHLNIIEEIVKKSMILFLDKLEKDSNVLTKDFRSFWENTLNEENILQKFNQRRKETLSKELDYKHNQYINGKKKI